MELIRGWESRYAPNETGNLRLGTARLFRKIGEEEGLGDRREGEIRVATSGRIESKSTGGPFSRPVDFTIQAEPDQPAVLVEGLEPGEARDIQYAVRAEDSALDSPFLFCLSRPPRTMHDWETLQAALPERYDTWTVTENVCALRFEIECGIERWMKLNGITEREVVSFNGWMTYSYDTTPPSIELGDLDEMKLISRWLQKRRMYNDQQEYRLGWFIRSPQMEMFPDKIDIELTRTGLGLFSPWSPPTR